IVTVFTACLVTSLMNCEYVRVVCPAVCTAGRNIQRNSATRMPAGSSQCRHAGGGGGGFPGAGLSPGGGGTACLLIRTCPLRQASPVQGAMSCVVHYACPAGLRFTQRGGSAASSSAGGLYA